ncbi:hypothetical protein IFM89_030659 [Coptis chinensis]|uniref:Uncharacterized protein n=1 Tax=Coptis chinensis TaxID=261450 RepID=A0A835LC79_9MAGN|nr:hypothetical protein IFM89_030659 [Coptis chinensis]
MNYRTDKAYLISSAPWSVYLLLVPDKLCRYHVRANCKPCALTKCKIKIPYRLQWGAPTFDVGHAFGMMPAIFVSIIESTGAYKAALRLPSATPPPAHVLSRGIGW